MNKYKNKNDKVSIIKQTTPVSDIFHLHAHNLENIKHMLSILSSLQLF